MAFPQTPRDIYAEMFLGTNWVDVSSDVLQRSAIYIERGTGDEADRIQPSTCGLDLKNPDLDYSPRNPLSANYGLLGRNTPLRVGFIPITDTFTRTVVDGWGSTTTGEAWTNTGAGGTVQASDFQVNGTKGTHLVPATTAYRISYLPSKTYTNVEVRATVTLSFTDVTGGNVEPANLVVRGQSTTRYYFVRLVITTAEAVTIALHKLDGSETVIASAVTVTGLTHSSAQALRVAVQISGYTIRAKVWATTGVEPYDWHVSATDSGITTAGWVAVRSGVASGNTNIPVTFTYDDLEVRVARAATEISKLTPHTGTDASGNDPWVSVESAGILRRLQQGDPPELSSLRRAMIRADPTPVAYWPCEDGSDATVIATGVPGLPDMTITPRFEDPDFASNTDFVCSAPLPQIAHAEFMGAHIPPYDNPNEQAQVRFLLSIPTDEVAGADGGIICRVNTTGSIATWDIVYGSGSGGTLTLNAYDRSNVLVDTDITDFDITGLPCMVFLNLDQDGTAVDWELKVGDVPTDFSSASVAGMTGTVASQTLGIVTRVVMSVGLTGTTSTPFEKTAVGHITVYNELVDEFEMARDLGAWAGELAGDRFLRLCEQEGIEIEYIGSLLSEAFYPTRTDTAKMGPQPVGSLIDLLIECVEADRALLYEPLAIVGLGFRAHETLPNQTARAALDYADHEIQPPLSAPDDDQNTRNDITVKRSKGSEYRIVEETGPLSVLSPPDGAGRIDDQKTVNVFADGQLPDIAGWLLNLGTVEGGRYPEIVVDLANPNVVANSGLSESVLGVDIGDRITIDNASAAGEYDQISQLVLGYQETLNPYTHTFTFTCVPEEPYQVIEYDDSGVSRWDSDDSTLHAAITSSTTSLSVVGDEDGTLWTTDAAQFPFSIAIGGEKMTLTDVDGGVTFVAAGTAVHDVNANLTPSLPAGAVAGDLLLILAAIRNSGAGNVDGAIGYTYIAGTSNFKLLGKIHTGTESAPTVAFSGGVAGADTSAQMCAFRGVTVSALDTGTNLNGSAQDISVSAKTLSRQLREALIIWGGWKQDDWTSVAVVTDGTEIGEPDTTTGDDQGIVWNYQIVTGNTPFASVSARTFTVTGGAAAISRDLVAVFTPRVQTFTVTRAVNGVAKSHAAGAEVHLARRARFALEA